jgi:hypothetical protein
MNSEPLTSSPPFAVVVNDDPTQLIVLFGLEGIGYSPKLREQH